MVPYFYPRSLVIVPGVLEFHTFGLLVGIAVIAGSIVAQRRATQNGLSARVTADGAIWFVIIGFLFAHWVSVLFYFPERIFGTPCTADHQCGLRGYYGIDFSVLGRLVLEPAWLQSFMESLGNGLSFLDSAPETYICQENGRCNDGSPWSLAMIWAGISSIGGFLGAFIAILIFFRVKKIPLIPKVLVLEGGKNRPALKYLDCFAYGMVFAWIFGRMACYTAHDHIGKLTHSVFGMRFPKEDWNGTGPFGRDIVTPEAAEMFANVDYVQRFDLGFLEMLWAIGMFAFFFFWARKQKNLRPGWYVAATLAAYGPYRVFLDSLRATDIPHADPRYDVLGFEMTAAQVGAVVMFLLAGWVWYLGGKAKEKEGYMDNSAFPLETNLDADGQPIEDSNESKNNDASKSA
jgi:prolipoprotein diacylglyceryltransferase